MSVIISIFIIIFLFKDYKKAVFFYTPWKCITHLIELSSIHNVTIDLCVSLVSIFIFLLNRKYKKNFKGFPLKFYFITYAIIMGLLFVYPSFSLYSITYLIICTLGYCVVYYCLINNEKDVKMALMGFSMFSIIVCFNGLIEFLFNINIVGGFIDSLYPEDYIIYSDVESTIMAGNRIRSVFPISISYGVACMIIFYLYIYFLVYKRESASDTSFLIIIAAFLITGVLTSSSRSAMIGIVPILFASTSIINRIKKKLIPVIILLGIFMILGGDHLIKGFESLFVEDVANEVGGSSFEMRKTQLLLSLSKAASSPFWGLGAHFEVSGIDTEMYGAESVWFPLIIKHGLFGVIIYIFMYINCFRVSRNTKDKQFLYSFIIAWFIMRTATSLSFAEELFFPIFFLMLRVNSYYGRKHIAGINNMS